MSFGGGGTAARIPDALLGALVMLVAAALLSTMHAMVRHLGAELHPFEIAFFRNLFATLAVLPLVARTGFAQLRSRAPGLQLARSVVGVMAMLSWFYGLSVVPLAEATALSFTAVIFGSIGAMLFLREPLRASRAMAVLVGFAGTLVILRPGAGAVDSGAFIVLFSSGCWAVALLFVKRLSAIDSTVCIVAWNSIALTVLSLPAAVAVWQTPTAEQLLLLAGIGALAVLGHLAMTKALGLADAGVVLPMDYSRLLWAAALGFLVFAEVPDLWTWVGGVLIVASTVCLSYRESRAGRLHVPKGPLPAPAATREP
jgi:drug/metabolite transporter (DMT)-like permease